LRCEAVEMEAVSMKRSLRNLSKGKLAAALVLMCALVFGGYFGYHKFVVHAGSTENKAVVNTLEEYNAYLKEEIEASMRLEPGVLVLYAVAEKERPHHVTILEIYVDEAAYKSHIATPHFQKYKKETLDMVQSLELVDTTPLIPGLKIK